MRKLAHSSVLWAAAFVLMSQLAFAGLIPVQWAYDQRMDYSVIKDNLANVGRTLDLIRKDIEERGLSSYVIILGDSIAYSGPGGPSQAVSKYMNDIASEHGAPPVYNLAIPAGQMGDFYTLLLMLDERGISTDHVVLNLIYAGFVKRDPDPPIVYWLERDLERLDPAAYDIAGDDLLASAENKNRPKQLESFLEYEVYSKVPVLKFRDFVRKSGEYLLGVASRETGDIHPWYEKAGLREELKKPVYQRQFDPAPLMLDDSNLNVAFLRLIAGHQQGKDLLVFMSPVNRTLMSEEVSTPGFVENSHRLDDFLSGEAQDWGFSYADLSASIPQELFSDHLHLVSEGYEMLSGVLWDRIDRAGWFPR